MKSVVSRLGVFAVLVSAMGACVGAETDAADVNDGADGEQQTAVSTMAMTDDVDVDGAILESSAEGAAEADYVTCTGWDNGGYLCLAQCWGGSQWYYTGWSYPTIGYAQCGAKADKFCFDHFGTSPRKSKCWGTW
jgi:hypothetical protein